MAARKTQLPRKLTKEVEEIILRHLRAGAFLKHACEAAGIEYRTLKYWLEKAEAGQRVYQKFAAKVMKLRAEDAIRSQSIITRAQLGHIDGDWKAAAYSLERKHPKEYGNAAVAAQVTLERPSSEGGEPDRTLVQFYLPSNGRRPGEDEGET
jgi:hypothetical protein